MSTLLRVVKSYAEKFMAMTKIPNWMEETTENAIGKEITTFDLKCDSIIG